MTKILTVEDTPAEVSQALRAEATETLERGGVVFFPRLPFMMSEPERVFLDPAVVRQPRRHTGRARIIYEPHSQKIRCSALKEAAEQQRMEAMVRRYAGWARAFVAEIMPRYAGALEFGRTSYRPCVRTQAQGLYISSYLAAPTRGRRMLRVFTNVNPHGETRAWHFGEEPFESLVTRLLPRIKRGKPGRSWLLKCLGITPVRRTAYDDVMRQLRRLTKHNPELQRTAKRRIFEFPSGSTWIVCTDGLLHGALTGQFAFEQTLLLPVTAMAEPERSPLRILERLLGRSLA
ncbi:MAG TPA: Kdo hydroxylase family protein [Nitrococcus sp.]|nr:Kdo hydroxylase family protein [Nitrococcus sp.]